MDKKKRQEKSVGLKIQEKSVGLKIQEKSVGLKNTGGISRAKQG